MQLATILLIALVIIIVCIMWGTHKGFLRMLIPFCVLFISLVITKYSVEPVTEILTNKTSLYSDVKDFFADSVPSFEGTSTASEERYAIETANFPKFLKDALVENNNAVIYEKLGVTTFDEYVSSYIARGMTKLIAFLIVILSSFVIIRIIVAALKIANSLPVLHGISGFLGGFLGLLIGIVLATIVSMILCAVFTKTSGLEVLGSILNNPIIEDVLDYNVFLSWLS